MVLRCSPDCDAGVFGGAVFCAAAIVMPATRRNSAIRRVWILVIGDLQARRINNRLPQASVVSASWHVGRFLLPVVLTRRQTWPRILIVLRSREGLWVKVCFSRCTLS